MNSDDAFRELRASEVDMEVSARVADLQDDIRPHADRIIMQYTAYLTQFGFDDKRAFAALLKYLEVGQEMGHYDEMSFMALTVFMTRRLVAHRPRLARTLN